MLNKNDLIKFPCLNSLTKRVFLLMLLMLLTAGCGSSNSDNKNGGNTDLVNYNETLPSPTLVFMGTEDYTTDGVEYTRYNLNVENSSAYPDALFTSSPHLPPCGLNTNSSRTWVDIFDNNDANLYGFCALNSSDDMNSIWFALPKSDVPPESVYIVLKDREYDNTYTSNAVNILPVCYPDLPTPQLVYAGSEDYDVNGTEYTRYKLDVSNSTAFPNELFVPASYLPPCGLNTNSSRTWVDIYDKDDTRLYGFCALGSSDDLNSIWFALPKSDVPPESVYIKLNDRACEKEYTSNSVYIGINCYSDLPAPQLVFTGTEDYEVDSTEYTRYKFTVSNSEAFPNELFAAASYLPPCGLNTNSSRTWVDIYDNHDVRIYGFCALGSSDGLNSIWFALPKGNVPPESIYIVLNDRACEHEYTSNSVATGAINFLGNWLNEDPQTPGITRIEIQLDALEISVREWGSCTPDDCDWGIKYSHAQEAYDGIIDVFWDPGFVERTQALELVGPNRLMATTFSHYIDGSGRPDSTMVYYFNR